MSKRLSDYDYHLPEELIAQTPVYPRDCSRLLVLDRKSGEVEHKHFTDIINYLNAGDVLVLNETKVIPARLFGYKAESGGKVELLLLHPTADHCWEALVKPARRLKVGARIIFGDGKLPAEVIEELPEGRRIIQFEDQGNLDHLIDEMGEMPLPPYIKEKLDDQSRYQTVYAEHLGSAAAPTAGLHFTPELLKRIAEKGVHIAKVTLHVGLDTFRPVQNEDITDHHMHSEVYQLDQNTADTLNQARRTGHRIVAVGTTSVRTLESVPLFDGQFVASSGETSIFIYPGYQYQAVDALITNFHLPKSTLLMLVSALAERNMILATYQEAIKERYRFFSFGDAMLIK